MPTGFGFAAPLILCGLILLPFLYWLLRATPPAPRRQAFPALRLLRGLARDEQSPVRMPPWLLLLRLLAAALVIIGFAGPEIVPPKLLPGSGPVLLAIDNDWAAAPDWPRYLNAAREIIASAPGRGIILLPTAADAAGAPPRGTGLLSHQAALARLNVLKPQPWPSDRMADAAAVRAVRGAIGAVNGVYLADGLTEGTGFRRFLAALAPIRVTGAGADAARLVLPPRLDAQGRLIARLEVAAQGRPVHAAILAEAADGRVLARSGILVKPSGTMGEAPVDLPLALGNRVARLVLAGTAAPGGIALLDGSVRRIVLGLAAGGQGDAEQKFLGALYYVRRALPGDRIETGSPGDLIRQGANAIVLADAPLDAASASALRRWIEQGGVLIRFAGPLTASHADDLSPDP
ncbi:MAG TPA: BatA domain-containing protein, partial [Acetobacteraceae bacterium]|nr:BatA domain-containing protein [Acetobacteraceae bacterium]